MATTATQDRNFRDELIPSSILEDAISWIKNNLEPDAVFTDDQLALWASDHGFIEHTDENE